MHVHEADTLTQADQAQQAEAAKQGGQRALAVEGQAGEVVDLGAGGGGGGACVGGCVCGSPRPPPHLEAISQVGHSVTACPLPPATPPTLRPLVR